MNQSGIIGSTPQFRLHRIELRHNDMDGATNMNISNAPPVITAGEAKKLKKTIAKNAAAAEKHVSQVSKSLRSAEKDESKAEKAAYNAQRACEKAVQEEHKTAQVHSDAQYKHNLAVAGENKAANDLSVRVLFPSAWQPLVRTDSTADLPDAPEVLPGGASVRRDLAVGAQAGSAKERCWRCGPPRTLAAGSPGRRYRQGCWPNWLVTESRAVKCAIAYLVVRVIHTCCTVS
ncbi:hypothetical protein V8E53_011171 [Lactarius tabidus]